MTPGEVIPHVVYHVAGMGNWHEVIREQLDILRDCGLADAVRDAGEAIRVTHVGPKESLSIFLVEAEQRGVPVTIVRTDANTDHYETFAMIEIERLAKEEMTDKPILYMHTKGVSNPSDMTKVLWRRAMMYAVVTKWRENVGYIADGGRFDAAGFIWIHHGEQHFTGTMWIARADWIRKLPAYVPYHHVKELRRYSCETWIGAQAHPTCRAFSHGPQGVFVHVGGFDFIPYLPPPNIPPVNRRIEPIPLTRAPDEIVPLKRATESVTVTGVTWLSAATPDYVNDLNGLQASFSRLSDGNELITRVLARAGRTPWRHCYKLDAMRAMIQSVETSHVFWIDADCRFLADIPPGLLIHPHPSVSLSAVQHFVYSRPADGIPPRLAGRLPSPAQDVYWQACLWGGAVDAVADVLDAVRWIANDERGYDEHALNIEFQNRPGQVNTLPCRFAVPETFDSMPAGSVQTFEKRAGGPALIQHCNREIRR